MRIKQFVILLVSIYLFSCEKDPVEKNTESKTDILTKNVWIYDEVYSNWGTSSQQLVYKKGATNNATNWGNSRAKYYKDGTVEEFFTTGQYVTSNWQFINNETQIKVTTGNIVNIVDVITLTEDNFDWHDLTSKNYGKRIPKK